MKKIRLLPSLVLILNMKDEDQRSSLIQFKGECIHIKQLRSVWCFKVILSRLHIHVWKQGLSVLGLRRRQRAKMPGREEAERSRNQCEEHQIKINCVHFLLSKQKSADINKWTKIKTSSRTLNSFFMNILRIFLFNNPEKQRNYCTELNINQQFICLLTLFWKSRKKNSKSF